MHVSTCYVAGTFEGTFGPEDLERGQGFRNTYEQSKHEAEVLVRNSGLPTQVVRPAIVRRRPAHRSHQRVQRALPADEGVRDGQDARRPGPRRGARRRRADRLRRRRDDGTPRRRTGPHAPARRLRERDDRRRARAARRGLLRAPGRPDPHRPAARRPDRTAPRRPAREGAARARALGARAAVLRRARRVPRSVHEAVPRGARHRRPRCATTSARSWTTPPTWTGARCPSAPPPNRSDQRPSSPGRRGR